MSIDGTNICTTGSDGYIKLISVGERCELITIKQKEPYQ